MGFMNEMGGLLQQYAGGQNATASTHPQDDLEQVARSAPLEAIAHGLSQAFRSDQTPAFGQMVSDLFSKSNPDQRAGLLSTLLSNAGPGIASVLGGAGLSNLLGQSGVTAQQASAIQPQTVEEIARHSEQHDPSIVDRVSQYYAQHPQLVSTVGKVAATVALAGIANHMITRER